MRPMMCKLTTEVPEGKQWIYERKFDGERCIATKKGRKVTLLSRGNQVLNAMYPELVAALEAQKDHSFMIDGEIVAFENKETSFTKLQSRMFVKNPSPALQRSVKIYYYVFDMMELNNKDLTHQPLSERKKLLKTHINFGGPVRYTTHKSRNGTAFFKQSCHLGWEGIIAKDFTSTYQHIRSPSWRKIKCIGNQELVIGGYTSPGGSRIGFGALLLGYYQKDPKTKKLLFHYAGKVGTGFDTALLKELGAQLEKITVTKNPFSDFSDSTRGVHWVKPNIVAQIGFEEWTKSGLLRQPRFLGLRTDKKAKDVGREDISEALKATPHDCPLKVGSHVIETSNEQKIFFPDDGITKGDIINYYHQVAPYMVPHLKNRPISMVRSPEGIAGESFFQKNIGEYFPSWIKHIRIKKSEGGSNDYVVCNNAATLVYLANQACLTPHIWLSKIDKLNYPDRIVYDFDPSPGVTFALIKKTALRFKKILEELGLTPFVMTTGSRGLHVVTPIKRDLDFDSVRAIARAIGELIVQADPNNLSMEARKEKRAGKLFIDCGRNAYAQTSVAPYAVRGKPKAPVATPLQWDELKNPKLTAQSFTINNVLTRLKKHGDPWKNMQKHAASLKKIHKILMHD